VSIQTLVCEKREIKSKGYGKGLRENGWVPGVIYGREIEPIPVALAEKQLAKTLKVHGRRGLCALQLAGEPKPLMVVIKELQNNPLSGRLVHIDLYVVNLKEKITSSVGLLVTGEEEVIKKGAVVQFGVKEVSVNCLPQDIPDYIQCDVSELGIGEKLTVGDLKVPDLVEIITESDIVVAALQMPVNPEIDEQLEQEEHGDEV